MSSRDPNRSIRRSANGAVHDHEAGRQQCERHAERRPAEHGLQVDREDELEAHVRPEQRDRADVGPCDETFAQDAETDERMPGPESIIANAARTAAATTRPRIV